MSTSVSKFYPLRIDTNEIRKAFSFGIWGAIGAVLGDILGQFAKDILWIVFPLTPDLSSINMLDIPDVFGHFKMLNVLRAGMWFGLTSAGIVAAIVIGLTRYHKRRVGFGWGLLLPFALALAGGFITAAAVQYFSETSNQLVRAFNWGVTFAAAGAAIGLRVPNLGWRRGAAGGGAGGLLGGLLFIYLRSAYGPEHEVFLGHFGSAVTGFLIGLMIVVADAVPREAWLEVIFAPNERRIVSLGAEPVSVGSGDCTVVVHGAGPGGTYVFRVAGGRVLCEDVATGRTEALSPGEARRLGSVELVVHAVAPAKAAFAGKSPRTTSEPSVASSSSRTLVLRLPRGRLVSLTPGRRLAPGDVPGLEPARALGGMAVAEVAAHPSDRHVLGLRNLSHRAWRVRLPDHSERQIEPGRTIVLREGVRIDFGSLKGEIA